MEKGETEEPTGDNWYIKNPFSGGEYKDINTKLYESVNTIVKEELLNESSYNKFKREVTFRTKSEQLHKAIREVKRKLAEIDRIVEYTSRMKQELSEGEDGIKYWKATQNNVARISEMINHLNNKIKNLQQ
jgi:predicted transcriptional regulator